MTDEKSKIIVDDDWKSKVEAEKETLQKEFETEAEHRHEHRFPPASFPILVSTLTTQTLVSLGQLQEPTDGKVAIDLQAAKHFIDILAVLEEKTKGNLTAEESNMLTDVLHQLRLAFVTTQNALGKRTEKPSEIELP